MFTLPPTTELAVGTWDADGPTEDDAPERLLAQLATIALNAATADASKPDAPLAPLNLGLLGSLKQLD